MQIQQRWAEKQLSDVKSRVDSRLVDIPTLGRIHVQLDKSVLTVEKRDLIVPSLSLVRDQLASVPSLSRQAKKLRRILDIPSLGSSINPHAKSQLWCGDAAFGLTDLTRLPVKSESTPNEIRDRPESTSPAKIDTRKTVITQNELSRCLQALLRGMESRLFIWSAQTSTFSVTTTYEIPGLSLQSQKQLLKDFLAHGAVVRRLHLTTEDIYTHAWRHNATVIALAVFIREFLDYCLVLPKSPAAQDQQFSLLELRNTLQIVERSAHWLSQLLRIGNINEWSASTTVLDATQLLNLVEEEVRMQTSIISTHDQIVLELFDRLMSPLVADVFGRTGLGPKITINSGVLISKGQVNYTSLDYEEVSQPRVLPSRLCQAINELERAMLFLEQHGNKDFLQSLHHMRNRKHIFVSLNRHIQAEHDALDRSAQSSMGDYRPSGPVATKHTIMPDIEHQMMQDFFRLGASESVPTLEQKISRHSSHHNYTDLTQDIEDTLAKPLLHQGAFVHGEVMRILLHEMQLQEHLELAQQVFLLQNGNFTSSLCEAIFSRNGNSMNLNDHGQKSRRWPPPAAKVSRATRTLLLDSIPKRYAVATRKSMHELEFLGRLGFMMSLDEAQEVSRSSLEALSFLVFNFQPPKPVDLIMTNRSLRLYTRINQFLLLLLRMNNAIDRLTRQAMQYRTMRRMSSLSERFRIEATHFVRSFSAHIFETVIPAECKKFDHTLHQQSTSIERLREAHTHMLEQISHGTLSSSKMAEIQAILRRAFEAILSFSFLESDLFSNDLEAETSKLYSAFDQNARKLINILSGAEATKEDSFAAGISARFMMNDFYEHTK